MERGNLMKKIIKTAMVAAMSILALGMMSCQKDNDEHGILEQTGFGASAQWTIDYTNETGSNYNRAFNVLSTKHTSGSCAVSIADPLTGVPSGVVGFVFGKYNNDDGTANFGLVGIQRYNATKVRYYVSWFNNVDLTKMDGFPNFCGLDGKPANSGTCEEIDKTSSWKELTNYAAAGANAVVNIEVSATGTPDSDGKVKEADSDGGYKVTLKKLDGTVIGSSITIDSSETGLTKTNQGTLGAYANVYNGRTMLATVTMSDLVQELAVEE